MKEKIVAEIRAARAYKKISQEELVAKCPNIKKGKYHRIENGEIKLCVCDLVEIAAVSPINLQNIFNLIEGEVYRRRKEIEEKEKQQKEPENATQPV